MNLESFGEQLRKQREQKQISLANVSNATRINVKFLQAIEAGNFSALPQTYIRAFIREYARATEMDPDEVIRQYDAANQPAITLEQQGKHYQSQSPISAPARTEEPAAEKVSLPLFSQRNIALGAIVVVAILVVVYVVNLNKDTTAQKETPEVSFDNVVKESEAAVVKSDSTPKAPAAVQHPTAIPAAKDSLHLEVATLDSVWMTITIDNTRKGEYLFAPKRKRSWVGKERFVVSLGNAGNATFRLNGVDLGTLGKRGALARNVVITASGIQKSE
ncbi:MAG: DUF4115 domain-containing protein [Ignavibacteriales bacterium]|nr:DUF4115 domain-containing protein [Ignavibacteriales bacterium]